MRKFKELMRLKFEAKLTHRQIGRSLGLSAGTVSTHVKKMLLAGLVWPMSPQLTDADIERQLFVEPHRAAASPKSDPDFAGIHQELKRKGVTLALLWEEYGQARPEQSAYSYSQFCARYRHWRGQQRRSMRQTHRAGEKLFVDYCGPTVPVIDPTTGEVREANIFVAVLGASSYTYAEATWTQGLADWVNAHARAFEFLGGCPMMVVPDNLRSAVSKACRYEPDLNPTYQQMAAYFQVAVLPARPYRPRDKAKAEVAVQVVERWILARLRHQSFFSLAELNAAIGALLEDLNSRPFKKLPGSRRSVFEALDKPALKPLPVNRYVYTEVRKARVHIDYHVELDGHYYSVPHPLVKAEVEVHTSAATVSFFHRGTQVASHARSWLKGQHSTLPEHMPKSHRKHAEWTPGRFLDWAADIGPATTGVVKHLLTDRPHPEHGYRSCLGLLNLAKKYGRQRLEAACKRALAIGSPTRKSVLSILDQGLDRVALTPRSEPDQRTLDLTEEHSNVRGPDYYR